MSDVDRISRLRFDSAADFLAALSPSHPRWGTDPRKWIFRGHGDATWTLLAKAYRGEPYAAFGVNVTLGEGRQEWSAHSDAETALLDRFSRALDRVGLPIPTRALEVTRQGDERHSSADTHPDLVPLLALAQHFGLPTKLLDWTRQARFAAYFAAAYAAVRSNAGGDLAVWALRTDFVESLAERGVDHVELTIRTAPASSNPNLLAQHGLFTRTEGENAHRYAVDEFVALASTAAQSWTFKPWHAEQGRNPNLVPRPLMRCCCLPVTESPKLLRLLAYEGITGATMFPGYDGVVRAMLEEALWDHG